MRKVLFLVGSARAGSVNLALAAEIERQCAQAGLAPTRLDLRALALPVYDGDLEVREGLPEGAQHLRALMRAHDAFIIVSPEYNSSVPPLLKNAIDWASRAEPDMPGTVHYQGKLVLLTAATPGGLGGVRALAQWRQIFAGLGAIVMPEQFSLSQADKAFDEQGGFREARHSQNLQSLLARFVALADKLFRAAHPQ